MTLLYIGILYRRVIVTPAVYPRLVEFLHFDIQSTGQKSHCVNTPLGPSQCYVLIRQSDSPCPYRLIVDIGSPPGRARGPCPSRRLPVRPRSAPCRHSVVP